MNEAVRIVMSNLEITGGASGLRLLQTGRFRDRIMVLNFGERIAEGTPKEVIRNPEVIKAYLGEDDPGWRFP